MERMKQLVEQLTKYAHEYYVLDNPTVSDIEYDKETVIIVYCASGMRSAEAAKILIQEGYTNVYNLDGGLINWGFELVE